MTPVWICDPCVNDDDDDDDGQVGSWQDKDGNHIEMGLHVFFGCYYNFFGIFRRLGIFDSALRLKVHTHQFVNKVRSHRFPRRRLFDDGL